EIYESLSPEGKQLFCNMTEKESYKRTDLSRGDDVSILADQAEKCKSTTRIDLATLLDNVEQFIRKYVVIGEAEGVALTLWIAHTHTFAAAECTPYIHITSAEKQSGKTLLLETLSLLVARPWLTSRVSAAVLVRKVDRDTPTLLLDETDTVFKTEKEYAEALRGLLNAGYRKGGVASMCVTKGGDFALVDFSTFCPKALAGIGKLPDTIADRSIRLNLKRRSVDEKVARFRLRDAQIQAEFVREQLERWADTVVEKLEQEQPESPEELPDRAADVWESLFAISDMASSEWSRRSREAALVLTGHDADDGLSLGTQLLRDISIVLDGRISNISSSELVEFLIEREESPWGDLRGRSLDPRKLASLLKPYGIKPHTVRVDSGTLKGYQIEDFQDAFARYIPHIPEIAVTSVTSVTKGYSELNLEPENVTDVTDVTVKQGIHSEDDSSFDKNGDLSDCRVCGECEWSYTPELILHCNNCGYEENSKVNVSDESTISLVIN
ncbi:MAG: DUF3631 domain-containing protein, partial [Dehalococcoidales bacterium]